MNGRPAHRVVRFAPGRGGSHWIGWLDLWIVALATIGVAPGDRGGKEWSMNGETVIESKPDGARSDYPGCGGLWGSLPVTDDLPMVAVQSVEREVSHAHDALMVEGADDELRNAEQAIAAGDVRTALRSLADATTALDEIGRKDPDRDGSPLMLGSRLIAVLRGVRALRDAELDALIAEP